MGESQDQSDSGAKTRGCANTEILQQTDHTHDGRLQRAQTRDLPRRSRVTDTETQIETAPEQVPL
jgi:hypothetical protein